MKTLTVLLISHLKYGLVLSLLTPLQFSYAETIYFWDVLTEPITSFSVTIEKDSMEISKEKSQHMFLDGKYRISQPISLISYLSSREIKLLERLTEDSKRFIKGEIYLLIKPIGLFEGWLIAETLTGERDFFTLYKTSTLHHFVPLGSTAHPEDCDWLLQ